MRQKLLSLDRRWIFLLVAVVAFIPFLIPFSIPGMRVTEPAQRLYDAIEKIPAGSAILVSADYGPSNSPELQPMMIAILEHAFRKDLRVVGMTLWPAGIGLAERALRETAVRNGKTYGTDYAFLGWKVGNNSVIVGMGQDIAVTFPTDHKKTKTETIPVMAGIRRLADFALVASLSAGDPGIEQWVVFGGDKCGVAVGGGATGVMTPRYYPFLQTGQMVGFLGSMKGAAEYEMLVGCRGTATAGMVVQSLAHFLIIGLVVLGNVLYLSGRKKGSA